MTGAAGTLLLVLGVLFLAVSTLGVLRLPDFFTRAHAMGNPETLGAVLVISGLAVLHGLSLTSLKLALIVIFIAVANPVATHALVRAALRSGVQPWVLAEPSTSRGRDAGERDA